MKPSQAIVWTPSEAHKASSVLTSFARYLNAEYAANIPLYDHSALHAWTVSHAPVFWLAVASFFQLPLRPHPQPPPDPTLPNLLRRPPLSGFSLNFAEAVLRHAESRPHHPAILCAGETGRLTSISTAQLADLVARLAAAHRRHLSTAVSVAAVVPATAHAVAAMLATAAVGAVWSSCSPDFGPAALIARFSQTRPTLLFYCTTYVYKGRTHDVTANITALVDSVPSISVLVSLPVSGNPGRRVQSRATHFSWDEFTSLHEPLTYEPVLLAQPLVTMFSSGTTGSPKCIVQGPGIILNQVKEHALHLNMTPASVVFYATSTGWMIFNWLVACLVTGSTILLYDGAALPPSDPLRMVHLCAEARVTHFGSGAKFFQALSQRHIARPVSIPTLNTILATGSPSTEEHFSFVRNFFGPVQYVSMSGGTEINGCFALGSPWKPVYIPELQCAGLGMDVAVFNEAGEQIVSKSGELVCRNAAPCMPLYFLGDNDHARYRASYFAVYGESVWAHGDFAEQTVHGGFVISGRSDSTLNPGGVRIGTADIYEIVEKLDNVEGALVTEQPVHGDSRIILLLVIRDGVVVDEKMKTHISHLLRIRLSPRHVPFAILQVPQIPFTFSGKKCEVPVKRILQGRTIENREAVQNPEAFDEIRTVLQRYGILSMSEQLTPSTPSCKL